MIIQNKETRRRFTFAAPYTLEGPDVVKVPFPAAARRYPDKDGVIIHDCNPAIVNVGADMPSVIPVKIADIQPCSMMIVSNEKEEDIYIGGNVCPAGKRTILMFDGWEYQQINAPGSKGVKGDTGEKGAAFTYADFTPEQLATLKGEKGDKGDPGEKGEKGDPGSQTLEPVKKKTETKE